MAHIGSKPYADLRREGGCRHGRYECLNDSMTCSAPNLRIAKLANFGQSRHDLHDVTGADAAATSIRNT